MQIYNSFISRNIEYWIQNMNDYWVQFFSKRLVPYDYEVPINVGTIEYCLMYFKVEFHIQYMTDELWGMIKYFIRIMKILFIDSLDI